MRNPIILVSLILIISQSFAGVSASKQHPKHFVLVHGVCFGAWSWYKIIPPLKSRGHNVTAIDLAASGINLSPANELRTFSDYSKPLIDFMESLPSTEKVILVAHSLGGAAISQAMELFPQKICVAVFLSALMPGPSLPLLGLIQTSASDFGSALDNKLSFDDGPNNPPTSFIYGPKYLSQVVYKRSPPEDAALATLLERVYQFTSYDDLVLTEPKYGSVNRVYLLSENDEVLPKKNQELMIEKNPPNRVERIRGADHIAMTSQPAQLLARLYGIAQRLC